MGRIAASEYNKLTFEETLCGSTQEVDPAIPDYLLSGRGSVPANYGTDPLFATYRVKAAMAIHRLFSSPSLPFRYSFQQGICRPAIVVH